MSKRLEFVKTVREVRKTYEGKTYTYGYVYLHLPADYAGKKVRIVVEPLREPEAQAQAQPQQDWLHELLRQRTMDNPFPTIYVPPAVRITGEPHDPVRKPSKLDTWLISLKFKPRPKLPPRELAKMRERLRRTVELRKQMQRLSEEEEKLEIQ